jgi:hypothetical protein
VRIHLGLKVANVTFFGMIAQTQTLEGVTSLQKDKKHIVMWDLENCTLQQAEKTLEKIQRKYRLSHIYIASDSEGSYRAWCFSKVSFGKYLSILVDSLSILDYKFFYYTVKRRKATLRTSAKKGRPPQRVVSVVYSYPVPMPKSTVEKVVYDTGLEKRGISLMLGGD